MANKKFTGHIAIFAANIFFGLNNPLSRSIIPEIIDPYVLTFLRIAGGLILFWAASLFVKKENVPLKDIFLFFLAAIFAITSNQIPFIVGLSMTTPIDASIVVTLLPILSMIFAALFIKEPITLMKAIGVIVGASGALVLIFSSHGNQVGSGNFTGNLVVLVGVISFSLYITIFKNLISKYSPITSMKWMFLFGALQSFPFCQQALFETDFTSIETLSWLKIAYTIVIATFLGYILIATGQKILRPTTLSMYNYLQPIVAAIVAVVIGMDHFGIEKIISAVLVFSGVYIVTQSKTRAQIEAEKAGIPVAKDQVGN